MQRAGAVSRRKATRASTLPREHEAPALGSGLLNRRDARGRCAARVLISSGCAAETFREVRPAKERSETATGLAALGSGMRRHPRPWRAGHRERRRLSSTGRPPCSSISLMPTLHAAAMRRSVLLVFARRLLWLSDAGGAMPERRCFGRVPGSCVPCENRSTPTALYLP